MASRTQRAQTILASIARKAQSTQMDLLLFTVNSKLKQGLKGQTQGLEGIIKMIDDMVVLLGKDQADDDKSKTYCEDELEKTTDEQKAALDKKAQVEAEIS